MRKPKKSAGAVVEEALAGNLDNCDWHKFLGWACNPADPDKPLWLEALIDDQPPVALLANCLRGDLASAGFGHGWVGFHLYFPTPLDPRKPHTISVRRASDGQHLPQSPWQLPAAPAGEPDARREFEAIMSAEIEATRSSVELSAMTDFMMRQTDRLLQGACDTDSGSRARALFKARWAQTLDGTPQQVEMPDPRPVALFIGFDLPADKAAKEMVESLQVLDMRVAVAAMRGMPTTGEAAEALTVAGVLVLGAPLLFSIEDLLGRHAGLFRVIVLHGVLAAAAYGVTARLHNPGARIVAWLDDPTQDAKASLVAQLLSDVVVTGSADNAALLDQRIRGWPILIFDPEAEPGERAETLARAIRPPPKAKPAATFVDRQKGPMLDHSHQDLLLSLGLFVPSFYREAAALPADLSDGELFKHFVTNGLPTGISPSPLFDAETVLAAARAAGLPPPETNESALGYWLRLGLAANIVPTALFDASYYRPTYPEVASAGYFGFQHFLEYGLIEKRRPSLGVDPHWIAARMPPSSLGLPALLQFVQENASGCSPSRALRLIDWPTNDPATVAACICANASLNRLAQDFTEAQVERLASLFLPEFYKDQAGLPGTTSDTSAFQHFVEIGLARGLSCSPLFDNDWYRSRAEARGLRLLEADEPPLAHWLCEGIPAEIVPTPCFDAAYYLAGNPDVAQAGGFSFLHFLDYGLFEERRANPWFDPDFVGYDPKARPGLPALLAYLLRHARDGQPPCAVIAAVTEHAPPWARDVATFGAAYPVLKTHYADLCASLPDWGPRLLFALFEPAYYLRSARLPKATRALVAFAHFLKIGLQTGIDPTPLFDCALYRWIVAARSDCVPIGAEGPLVHYLRDGILKRIVPTLRFDADFYMARQADFDPARIFGFEHYLCHGVYEGRLPNAWSDTHYCAGRIKGGDGLPPYFRLLMYGLDEGVVPHPTLAGLLGGDTAPGGISLAQFDALLAASHAWSDTLGHAGIAIALAMFIPEAYDGGGQLAGDVGTLDRLIHFIAIGLARGDAIGPLFDPAFYLAAAEQAGLPSSQGLSPLQHFLQYGFAARVVPTPVLDPSTYLSFSPDVAGKKIWPFEHFIHHGIYEGRLFSKLPMVQIAVPVGTASRRAARLRLMIATGHIPERLPPAERARIGGLIESQNRLRTVMASGELAVIMAQAQALDPAVGELDGYGIVMMPPFYNPLAEPHRSLRARMPRAHYDSVVCVPWVRNGGADLVAGLFTHALRRTRPDETVLLLRTDRSYYERPDWIPSDIDVVDISDILTEAGDAQAEQLLYTLFLGLAPQRVVNINSRLAWQCLRRYGERMASSIQLYGYLFCWDQTASGRRVGYPTDFYPPTAPFMAGVFTDTQYLKNELTQIYALPKMLQDRLMPLRSAARVAPASPTMGELGAASAADRARPVVLWGGRLDYQKRFDLVIEIARRMPHVDFRCWGTAMLDAPPDLAKLPANISMHGDFKAFTDLPLGQCDGWLFTSAWEGMPTTVIELATLGMPMVCSGVGGVPDLIDASTGWPIDPQSDVNAYVDAVQDMVDHPDLRVTKALMAQARVVAMFSPEAYDRSLAAYLERPAGDLVA